MASWHPTLHSLPGPEHLETVLAIMRRPIRSAGVSDTHSHSLFWIQSRVRFVNQPPGAFLIAWPGRLFWRTVEHVNQVSRPCQFNRPNMTNTTQHDYQCTDYAGPDSIQGVMPLAPRLKQNEVILVKSQWLFVMQCVSLGLSATGTHSLTLWS